MEKPERRTRRDRVDYRKLNSVGNDDYDDDDDDDETTLEAKKKNLVKIEDIKQEKCQNEESVKAVIGRNDYEVRRSQVLSNVRSEDQTLGSTDAGWGRSRHEEGADIRRGRLGQNRDWTQSLRDQLEIERLKKELSENETRRLRLETRKLEEELKNQLEREKFQRAKRDLEQKKEELRLKAMSENHGRTELAQISSHSAHRSILRTVLKSQIKQLVEQLSHFAGEEAILLSASLSEGTLSHIGSQSGESFLSKYAQVKSQFLGHCLNKHRKSTAEEDPPAHTSKQSRTEKTTDNTPVNPAKRARTETTTENLPDNPAKHPRTDTTSEKLSVVPNKQTSVEQNTQEHIPINANKQTTNKNGKTVENLRASSSQEIRTEKTVVASTSNKLVPIQRQTHQQSIENEVLQNIQDDHSNRKSSDGNLSISVYGSESSYSLETGSEDEFEDDFDNENEQDDFGDENEDDDFGNENYDEDEEDDNEDDDNEKVLENNEGAVKKLKANKSGRAEETISKHTDTPNKHGIVKEAIAKLSEDSVSTTVKPQIKAVHSKSDHTIASNHSRSSDDLERFEAMEMVCEDILGDIDLTDGDSKILVEDVGETVVMVKEEPESDVSVDAETENLLGPPNISAGDLDPEMLPNRGICKQENTSFRTNDQSDLDVGNLEDSPTKKRRTLSLKTLEQKYHAIMEVERGRRKILVARELGIPGNTLSTWLRFSAKIKEDYLRQNYGPNLKRRPSNHPDIEKRLLGFVKEAKVKNVPVSSPMLVVKANQLARNLGYTEEEFTCNSNWVIRFKKRHGLTLHYMTECKTILDSSTE